MYAKLFSSSIYGIDAFTIEIEIHLENGLPAFQIVGLPDATVREARERVIAALKNSGLTMPSKKITVNLAPANIKKEGSGFDFPIAIGILAALGQIPTESLEKVIIIGELALDGKLRPINGLLPISIQAQKDNFTKILVPKENAQEAALVDNLEVIGIDSLEEAFRFLNNELVIEPTKVDVQNIFTQGQENFLIDMGDVKGQENVKRALEVAVAGGHNILMIGPPGSGKSMLAKRIPTIMPPLSMEEALETTKIHSIAGILPQNTPLITVRPFRSPHHTISDAALVGGGINKIRPGEISLAHHGILFMDEFPEFARNVLEVLRQPLEDQSITVSRTKQTLNFPANFMLVCSMNPCPCGHYGDPYHSCSCSSTAIQRYIGKISGPLLDRIDIHVEVPAINYQEISSKRVGEPSASIKERIIKAREIQKERFKKSKSIFKNSDMTSKQIRKYCELDETSNKLLKTAIERMGLSARGYDRILKVSRTIADLDNSEHIQANHISEAIQYRALDRDYWK